MDAEGYRQVATRAAGALMRQHGGSLPEATVIVVGDPTSRGVLEVVRQLGRSRGGRDVERGLMQDIARMVAAATTHNTPAVVVLTMPLALVRDAIRTVAPRVSIRLRDVPPGSVRCLVCGETDVDVVHVQTSGLGPAIGQA